MYDTDMALRLKELGRPRARPAWHRAQCVSISPLRFSIVDGQFQFESGKGLTLTRTASNVDWRTGYTAAAILSGGSLLVLDRI